MKIRDGFVTNSSSYSYAVIRVDNPVLLEILKKYKDGGAFRSYMECGVKSDSPDGHPLAFSCDLRETAHVFFAPASLETVADCIMKVILGDVDLEEVSYEIDEDDWYYCMTRIENRKLFEDCQKELAECAEEINENYIEVFWDAINNSFGEFAPDEGAQTHWEFYYKKEQP